MPIRKKISDTGKLEKTPTGIKGFDEITSGGLPKGRLSMINGAAGCGKTIFCVEFLLKGAVKFNEPGVLITFEESEKELIQNISATGFEIEDLIKSKKLMIDYVHIERSEIEETGEYDLEALFIRLNYAIDFVGAKRLVIDSIESLFSGIPNTLIVRSEMRRLFRWLKDKGITSIVTTERGENCLTRYGLEEYLSDCVIILDQRVMNQISVRRLRILKYRGTDHGTNEYPFVIGDEGISILPITSLGLNYKVSAKRITSGIPALDAMLGSKGFYLGSSILISGTAGTGKTSFSSFFAASFCKRGERVLFFSFEESEKQIIRNIKSIGLNLNEYVEKGILKFHCARTSLIGIEAHLVLINKMIEDFKPEAVIFDPINSFADEDNFNDVRSMILRLMDGLKINKITACFTILIEDIESQESTSLSISSMIDTWIVLQHEIKNDERIKTLNILKSRGMKHSNKISEFFISGKGINIG